MTRAVLLSRKSRYVPRIRIRPEPQRRVRVNTNQICLFLKGQWELITLAPLPTLDSPARARAYDGGGLPQRVRQTPVTRGP